MASSWGFLNSLANSIFSSGGVHDYAHAAQVFRTSGFSRSPKYKYLFYVNFVIGTDIETSVDSREIGVLVKSVDLPKFTVNAKTLNSYNRKNIVQTHIQYDPVTVVFHDDAADVITQFWNDYYTYYFRDSDYNAEGYKIGRAHV